MNNEINPGSGPADATNGHKPANAEFDLAAELKALEKTVNRLENALCGEEYRETFVHRDCCKLLDHIVSQIENIIVTLGAKMRTRRQRTDQHGRSTPTVEQLRDLKKPGDLYR